MAAEDAIELTRPYPSSVSTVSASSMGKGGIAPEFPGVGRIQPAHLGSQSVSPDKDDPTPNMKSFGNNRIID